MNEEITERRDKTLPFNCNYTNLMNQLITFLKHDAVIAIKPGDGYLKLVAKLDDTLSSILEEMSGKEIKTVLKDFFCSYNIGKTFFKCSDVAFYKVNNNLIILINFED